MKIAILFVVLYFPGLILAHKYGHCHVNGLWLLPLILVVGIAFWRDHRASRKQQRSYRF